LAHAESDAFQAPEVAEMGETLEGLAEACQVAPTALRAKMLAEVFEKVRVDLTRRQVVAVKP
jgi:hypothetical protein